MVVINEALILAIAVLAWVVYRYTSLRHSNQILIGREVVVNLLFVYLIFVVHLTFFPMNIVLYSFGPYKANFVPLVKTIHMIRYINPYVVVNILGNLVLLAPLGIFLPALSARYRRWRVILATGFLVTLGIELSQYFLAVRVFDIDDLLLNTLGVGIGYALFVLLAKIPFVSRWLARSHTQNQLENHKRLLIYGLFVLVAFLSVFFYKLWSQTETRSMLLDALRGNGQQICAQGESGRYFFIFSQSPAEVKKVDYFRQVIFDRYTPIQYIENLSLAKEEFTVSGTSYGGEDVDFLVIARSDQVIAAMTSDAQRYPVIASEDYYFSFASLPLDQQGAYFSFGFVDTQGNPLGLIQEQ